jgi:hypothetical protein
MRPIWKLFVVAVGVAVVSINSASAQPLLAVLRVGDGTAALSSASAQTNIDEYLVSGTSASLMTTVNVSALVASGSSGAVNFSNAGNATSEGQLQLSGNGQYLVFAGYNSAVGTAAVASTAPTSVQREVGLMNASGTVTTTLLGTTVTGNARSAYSTNGSDIWVGSSSFGVNYTSFGSGSSTQLSTSPTNTRVVNVFGGQLYMSSASGAFQGVTTIGTGTPTTSGQTTTILPGFPTASGPSNYDFVLANSTTLYVADDRTTTGGGIEKWTLSAGTWTDQYSALAGASANVGMRSLAYDGVSTFYGVGSDGNLYSAVDTGTTFTYNLLATAPTNTAFRGVDFMPVPEPGSIALIGFAAVGFGGRLLRRKKAAV